MGGSAYGGDGGTNDRDGVVSELTPHYLRVLRAMAQHGDWRTPLALGTEYPIMWHLCEIGLAERKTDSFHLFRITDTGRAALREAQP